MADEWRRTTLGQLVDMASGKGLPEDGYDDEGQIPVMGSNGLLGWCNEALYSHPVITIGRVGACGEIHKTEGPAWVSDNALVTLPKEGVDFLFLYYLLNAIDFTPIIGGTTQPLITQTAVKRLEVDVPPLIEQQAIACILGALDDKIELNRRMDETLDRIARAVFKSWFVDFDPVRAKMEDQYSPLPKTLADVFPARLVSSELGEIPEGWSLLPLDKVLKETNERVEEMDVPEYSSTNHGLQLRSERFNKKLSQSSAKNKLIRKGNMVFGLSRRVLNFGVMRDLIGSVSAAYKVFTVNENLVYPDFLERLMRMRPNYFYKAVSSSSREGQSISSQGLGVLMLAQPSAALQDAFYRITAPFQSRALLLHEESRTLDGLRGALLPKLISRELLVLNAERIVRRCA